ncbi:hypothetical protein BOTBODRAFT_330992 [Botryobasidium botryosum FD-172 SS1]|uniref:Uncharacterized protein n=1 Tax=Botryobasidium botryosum (strain FD-172 SS1) TaxID=930990 RepID=A0A067MH66_BOTB1|nr:hypothetical protein BOTBODRAFT_330992 [Botryobasidium botryosum FD-172 SS1]
MHPGETKAEHLTASAEQYMHSGTVEHIKVAILGAFPDAPVSYDSSECRAALLKVILNNQMSYVL